MTKSQFERVKDEKELIFELATKENFLNQIKDSDVVYFGGGTTVRLMDKLKEYQNLSDFLKGKVIVGESAGANCMSVYCYSKSGGGTMPGLGLVPVKIIPHYEEGMEVNFNDFFPEIESLYLPEHKFKVFEI